MNSLFIDRRGVSLRIDGQALTVLENSGRIQADAQQGHMLDRERREAGRSRLRSCVVDRGVHSVRLPWRGVDAFS